MTPRLRLLVGLVLPPLIVSSLAAMTLGAITICPQYGCDLNLLTIGGMFGAAFGALIGVPTAVLAGLPAHHLLTITGKTDALFYVLAGALIGVPATLAGLAIFGRNSINMAVEAWAFVLAIGAGVGAVSALMFWLIRRPDRDAANPATRAP